MSTTLEVSIIFLIFTTIVLGIIIGVFLIKLLMDLSKLTTNLDETTTIVKQEIEPTLQEIKDTLNNINSIAKSADKQVDVIKKVFTGVLGASGVAFCGLKNISGGFFKGLSTALKLFKKK
ncbi:MAG: DUF948 domain-containing protein [Candidatus Gastranaerophilales bacterium]|nr:DUF948 domain-containing protein [Candidatus Gastranaerophilales bacterium]